MANLRVQDPAPSGTFGLRTGVVPGLSTRQQPVKIRSVEDAALLFTVTNDGWAF